jgi:hypothetical protein
VVVATDEGGGRALDVLSGRIGLVGSVEGWERGFDLVDERGCALRRGEEGSFFRVSMSASIALTS